MKLKTILFTIIISGIFPVTLLYLHSLRINAGRETVNSNSGYTWPITHTRNDGLPGTMSGDFSDIIASTQPAVVYITATTKIPVDKFRSQDPKLFPVQYDPDAVIKKTGSGVLISEDGYIITNEHLTSNSYGILVTLSDKRSFPAKLVGSDINTDLSVLKIEGSNFPFLLYGNSDKILNGQWVVALGYPLKLGATATAGIIGAQHQVIGVNKGDHPVEDFIQTDAAINTGSSGGALINTSGELIGINSAFLSPNGSFIGYSYAIPINLTKKVVNNLIKNGMLN